MLHALDKRLTLLPKLFRRYQGSDHNVTRGRSLAQPAQAEAPHRSPETPPTPPPPPGPGRPPPPLRAPPPPSLSPSRPGGRSSGSSSLIERQPHHPDEPGHLLR